MRLQRRNDVVDGRRNLELLVGCVSACDTGRTDSIHLSPKRVNDYTNSLVAGDRVVRVADIELDRHGDLAFIAGEIPSVEGNICGFHGWCLVVGFVVGFAVGFCVGFSGCFAMGKLRHD